MNSNIKLSINTQITYHNIQRNAHLMEKFKGNTMFCTELYDERVTNSCVSK